MTKQEFMRQAIGLPWIDRACDFEAMDCWGVVVMYFLHVKDIELPYVNGYNNKQTDIINGFHEQLSYEKWEACEPCESSVFMAYKHNQPVHVGVVISNSQAIHSAGTPGQVRLDELSLLSRAFHKIEFYKYVGE